MSVIETKQGDKIVAMELALPRQQVDGCYAVNKYGRSTNLDTDVATDIWDRANATDDQAIWVAPTQARTHTIVSGSASDTYAGVGAEIVRVYGLPTWDQAEVSEDITMDGTTGVTTVNSYVIIHRMKVIQSGSSGPNVGAITATAATDATVTAQINIGEGQTQMAIYGVPSTQVAYLTQFYCAANKGSTALEVNVELLANTPGLSEGFTVKHTAGVNTEGTSAYTHTYMPFKRMDGPCTIKMQGNSSALNVDASAGFDLILVDR